MCGRTACYRGPGDVCRACGLRTPNGRWSQPRWREAPGGKKYYTSYNVAPTSHTPVMFSKKHLSEAELESCSSLEDVDHPAATSEDGVALETEESNYVIQPMHWGLVPFWHQGEAKSTGYSMINARSDGMLTKRSFKVPLEKGRRCVVPLDGYFEWQKNKEKQPFYVYKSAKGTDTKDTKVEVDVKDEDKADVKVKMEVKSEDAGDKPMLMVAGLFDIWKNKEGEQLYSYSIITVDAHKDMDWLHDRMPAILQNESEVQMWLDFGDVPLQKAVELIRPQTGLQYHPVAKGVGNVHNKSPDVILQIDTEKEKPKPSASSNFMSAWLQGNSKSRKRSVSESDKVVVKAEVVPASEIKEEGDEPSSAKKLKRE